VSQPSTKDLYRAASVLAEHLSRTVEEDLREAAQLQARGDDRQIAAIAATFAAMADEHGRVAAREVLQVSGLDDQVIEAVTG
jgi:hypothetical protein